MGEHDASASKRRKVSAPDDEECLFAPAHVDEQDDKSSQKLENPNIETSGVSDFTVVEDKGKGKEKEVKQEVKPELNEEVKENHDEKTKCEVCGSPSPPHQPRQRPLSSSLEVPSPPARTPTPYAGPTLVGASMTAQQSAIQEQAVLDAADAPNQAEHGIDIDDFEDGEDPFRDDGYESDAPQSASTSLASTVYNYSFENGRRYHKFREGAYNFPNDDSEQEREDMKHAMVVNLCQVLHFAPLKNPQ